MGLTTTTAYVSALPLLFFSKWLFARTGHILIIILAFFTYAIRYIGYSFVPSMGYIFIFEMLEAVTQNLMYTAATEYGFAATPRGMSATVQGLIHMSHWAIGKLLFPPSKLGKCFPVSFQQLNSFRKRHWKPDWWNFLGRFRIQEVVPLMGNSQHISWLRLSQPSWSVVTKGGSNESD